MLFRLSQERLREKSKWVLLEGRKDSWDWERWRDKYLSEAERPDVIRKQFEVKQGLMTKV